MDISIFTEKDKKPETKDLIGALGPYFELWQELRDFAFEKYPKATEEWNYPGKKYGWSFRVKDKKRAIRYFLPRDNYFKVAFVFGQKAVDAVMESNIKPEIKKELQEVKAFAEGRGIGIGIDINGLDDLTDIKKLIEIKLAF